MAEEARKGLIARAGSATGAVVAVIASGVALIFTLKPGLAPDPGAGHVATVAVQAIESGVSAGEWDQRFASAQALATLRAYGGDRAPGVLLYVSVDVHGQKHGHVNLYTVRYDAARRAFPGQYPLKSAQGFNPGTPDDQWVAPVWVPTEGSGVKFTVRILLMRDNVILALADSPQLTG